MTPFTIAITLGMATAFLALSLAAQRVRLSAALIVGLGFACAVAGVATFMLERDVLRLGDGALEAAFKPAVHFLFSSGLFVAAAVPCAVVAGCAVNLFRCTGGRVGEVVQALVALGLWAALSYGMFIVMFFTYMYATDGPNHGFVYSVVPDLRGVHPRRVRLCALDRAKAATGGSESRSEAERRARDCVVAVEVEAVGTPAPVMVPCRTTSEWTWVKRYSANTAVLFDTNHDRPAPTL